jgi:hypothetical protein
MVTIKFEVTGAHLEEVQNAIEMFGRKLAPDVIRVQAVIPNSDPAAAVEKISRDLPPKSTEIERKVPRPEDTANPAPASTAAAIAADLANGTFVGAPAPAPPAAAKEKPAAKDPPKREKAPPADPSPPAAAATPAPAASPSTSGDDPFRRASTLRGVVKALVEQGIRTREQILDRCREIKANAGSPVLKMIELDELEDRVRNACEAIGIKYREGPS